MYKVFEAEFSVIHLRYPEMNLKARVICGSRAEPWKLPEFRWFSSICIANLASKASATDDQWVKCWLDFKEHDNHDALQVIKWWNQAILHSDEINKVNSLIVKGAFKRCISEHYSFKSLKLRPNDPTLTQY